MREFTRNMFLELMPVEAPRLASALRSSCRLSDNVKTIEKHVPGTFPHGLKITFDKRKERDLIKGPYDQAASISKI